MKLVWSPETSAKAYLDTIKACKLVSGSGEAELISAMAGGWNPKLIAEAWSYGNSITTSIGLAIAANHLGARHVCIVPDEQSRLAYTAAMQSKGSAEYLPEIAVGKAEEVVEELTGIEFLVVDGQRKEFCRVVRASKLSHRGAVLVCRNCSLCNMAGFRWSRVLSNATRVVRSLIVPVGKGLDIAYVSSTGGSKKGQRRWIVHVDRKSGEEHVFRG
ncbi:hypothetical protein DCAR_0728817 [Daucus carota subsp. sativus]|uniref:Uncharacterized protein n=1 Tax=Daucus carota subsp. sativus TaxID=79200 RepID=A0A164TV61_DAUCS|nr:PREDICTED: uncharacterized protein LOC108195496 [Daucus carota subsp. sativus]WOH09360.1 hypothetical protein DCAR_0728817 [Daucus carota subsp. sativus]